MKPFPKDDPEKLFVAAAAVGVTAFGEDAADCDGLSVAAGEANGESVCGLDEVVANGPGRGDVGLGLGKPYELLRRRRIGGLDALRSSRADSRVSSGLAPFGTWICSVAAESVECACCRRGGGGG